MSIKVVPKSAVLLIISAPFPPNSRVTLFRFDVPDAIWMMRPTSVEPVKATLLISGCSAMAAPAVGPKPGIMLTTPIIINFTV